MAASEHVDQLLKLLAIEERTRQLGYWPSTATTHDAAQIITQMGSTVGAIVRFIAAEVGAPNQSDRVEPAVVAAVVRMLIEQHETFIYLCADKISEPEREFRRDVYRLHKAKEEQEVIPRLPSFRSPSEDFFKGVVEGTCKIALEQNTFFKNLTVKTRTALLSGKSAFYNTKSGGSGRGVTRDAETTSLYKLFSNVVHGTALGMHAARTTRHRTRIDGHNLVALALSYSVRVFAVSFEKYTKLRPKIRACLSEPERKWLQAITNYPLEMWPRVSSKSEHSDTSASW